MTLEQMMQNVSLYDAIESDIDNEAYIKADYDEIDAHIISDSISFEMFDLSDFE